MWKHIELQLYLIILLGQKDRHADALALLEGEIGVKTKATENVELRHLRIELLIKTGRWKDARDATALILKEKYVTRRVSLLETNMELEHATCNVSTTPPCLLTKSLSNFSSDDWRTILQYFETIFLPVQDADLKDSENLKEARAFVAEQVKNETKNPKRGPFLAQIELERRVQEKIGTCFCFHTRKLKATRRWHNPSNSLYFVT